MLDYFLIMILIVSFVTDMRHRRILNSVTLPAMGIGLVYHLIDSGWNGLVFSGEGLLLGMGLLLIPFLLGGMGAGDVKLLAAVGAIKGVTFVFYAFIFTSIIGGLLAIAILIYQKELIPAMKRIFFALIPGTGIQPSTTQLSMPYGVAIVFGTLLTYSWSGL
ncbi:MAG TPA: prepilin peptidase [Bacillota bacterium]|nr:prepilin peptidase [Bacillota bacterium]